MEQNGLSMYDDFHTVYPPLFTRLIRLRYFGFEPWKSLSFGIARTFIPFALVIYNETVHVDEYRRICGVSHCDHPDPFACFSAG